MQFYSIVLLALGLVCSSVAFKLPTPLKVDCQSLGSTEEFRHRLKYRENAEDKATIWLFQNEVLNMVFTLEKEASIDVLDVRYSNDGDYDKLALSLDDKLLGTFKTVAFNGWGDLWNVFRSSGPIGGRQVLSPGKHTLSLKVVESDVYGVEIDYMRIEIHGSVIANNGKDQFMCIHHPTDSVVDSNI